jgi:glycosyltransferase involved in cell wall biosynthesis
MAHTSIYSPLAVGQPKEEEIDLSILVAIHGARMHYAVPIALESKGVLSSFYTDFYLPREGYTGIFYKLFKHSRIPILRRAAERFDDLIPPSKVKTFPSLGIALSVQLQLAKEFDKKERLVENFQGTFAKKVSASSWDDANAVYSINTASVEIFQRAQVEGIICILEQAIVPYVVVSRIYKQEVDLWTDWQMLDVHVQEEFINRECREWELADGVVCGSQFVVNSLVECGVPMSRCYLVPYCVNVAKFLPKPGNNTHHRRLHVLYLGSVDLRKGIQYLFQAIQLLGTDEVVVKVAGANMLSPYANKLLKQEVELLGLVPRGEIQSLFHWADVLVLPSLCEGSAMVTYEALSA